MDMVAQTVILGIVGAVICLVIQRGSPELSLVLAMVISLLIILIAMEIIGSILDFIDILRETAGLSPAIVQPLLKTVGISILTRLASDTCKDAGQGSIGAAVELTGTLAAIYIALPLMQTVFEMIGRLL